MPCRHTGGRPTRKPESERYNKCIEFHWCQRRGMKEHSGCVGMCVGMKRVSCQILTIPYDQIFLILQLLPCLLILALATLAWRYARSWCPCDPARHRPLESGAWSDPAPNRRSGRTRSGTGSSGQRSRRCAAQYPHTHWRSEPPEAALLPYRCPGSDWHAGPSEVMELQQLPANSLSISSSQLIMAAQ